MCSISLDRYARIHTTVPPPESEGTRVDQKGENVTKEYLTIVPSAVAWDGNDEDGAAIERDDQADEEEDVWNDMDRVGEETEPEERRIRLKRDS